MSNRTCETCGAELLRRDAERKKRRFCSVACRGRAAKPPEWLPAALDLWRQGATAEVIIERLGLSMGATGLGYHLHRAGARIQGVPAEQRFWWKVNKSGGPDACWPWTASRYSSGHGQFVVRSGGSPEGAHRIAWKLTHGEIPDGLVVRHKCDNRPCCNPAHLEIGTPLDNSRDMVVRKRNHLGSARPESKLTEKRVIEARRRFATGESCRSIAADFGVTAGAIHLAVTRRTWRHVGEVA